MLAMNKIEMMSEAIDETLDKDEVEKEIEKLTNQLSSAPKGRIASKNATPLVNVKSEPTTNVDDLEKRLASLQ
ncbi:Vacuolar sorting-associated protein 2 -like protein [Gossypium arboreum]|nr:Vacuolar sorting-associated protein 2 -like protein [Gossypium arboreum]